MGLKGDTKRIDLRLFTSMLQKKEGGHASNPLQLRIVSIFYGEHSMSPQVTFGVCLKI